MLVLVLVSRYRYFYPLRCLRTSGVLTFRLILVLRSQFGITGEYGAESFGWVAIGAMFDAEDKILTFLDELDSEDDWY